ncbi:MAG TPA: HAMP domain-containing sensor histidine kinase [Polyangiaceae bacterium]|jgi:signal transduction histidine kinase
MKKERLSAALKPGRLAWMLLTQRAALVELWTRRVREDPAVPDASRAPALEDHVSELMARLVQRLVDHPIEAWREDDGREVGASAAGIAHAHNRFDDGYTLAEALRELSHFRAAVLDLAAERRVSLTQAESTLLHSTIDEMMRASASEFERASLTSYELAMGVVAHDLRNSLNTVTMYAAQLQSGSTLKDPMQVGEVLGRSVRIMERLVEDLLVYSKIETGQFSIHPADVDLCALLRMAHENYQPLARRRRIQVSLSVPDIEVHAMCDGDRILQALGNIVINAIKFTPDGGAVRVELEPGDRHCLVRVRDTGPGIAPEHVDDIFRPFWQAPDTSAHGAGLGLAIAHGMIAAHGGELRLESRGPLGASFVFSLPYDGSPTPSSLSLPLPGRSHRPAVQGGDHGSG